MLVLELGSTALLSNETEKVHQLLHNSGL